MGMAPRYDAAAIERRLQETWAHNRIYEFAPDDPRPIFAVDTPPPTVSGEIHIGHVYSYVQAEAMIRFWRMQGYNVYYPFGFDDNGLPTERFVEKRRGVRARDLGRAAFIEACLEVSGEVEDRFEVFWKRLGMSVDWRLRYSTIDPESRRLSQWSFLDLYAKGRIYRAHTPNPWCIECQTAIAQAEIDDLARTTTFYTLAFALEPRTGNREPGTDSHGGDDTLRIVRIATTRPELLPACVAIMVHPDDPRYRDLIGRQAQVPLFGRSVPILADPGADPSKGTGVVMCCTFGDATDVQWWRSHMLPLIPLVTRAGRLSDAGGAYADLTLNQARTRIVADLRAAGLLLDERPAEQTVRAHERCGTPLEIIESSQWFVRILDLKEQLLELGRQMTWRPTFMQTRYEHWVQNLNQDWCVSRQRFFGVPFPAWHCPACGAVTLADPEQLPLDPLVTPPRACACGHTELHPDEDVMDTWATSSVSPWIAALRLHTTLGETPGNPPTEDAWAQRLLPMQLRPQAHDIIRTWAFYTIVKAYLHTGTIPWQTLAISGHALGPDGRKISKSKDHAAVNPEALIARHGADAVRYWACNGALGSDQPVNEQALRQGGRLMTKLWNAARLIEEGRKRAAAQAAPAAASNWPLDRALLSWLQQTIRRATAEFRAYNYAAALDLIERFFWGTFCDEYLEMIKSRLYDGDAETQAATLATMETALRAVLQLLAPIMPHVTEAIYQELFAAHPDESIHTAQWPAARDELLDPQAEAAGAALIAIAGTVRRYKSAQQRSMGSPLGCLRIAAAELPLRDALERSAADLASVSRAQRIEFVDATSIAGDVSPGGSVAVEIEEAA